MTEPQSPNIGTLIADISAAFHGVARGEGTSLHEAEAIDCHFERQEQLAERQRDVDKDWHHVPDQWIASLPMAYYFMNAEGLRYYLPAVMIWAMKHGNQSDSSSGDNIESLLMSSATAPELYRILTDEQRWVVARWVEWQTRRSYPLEDARERLQKSTWRGWLSRTFS